MDTDQMVTLIATILIPMLGGFGWMLHRMDSKFEEVQDKIDAVAKDIQTLDSRLSHLEGYLMGRYEKTGTKQ